MARRNTISGLNESWVWPESGENPDELARALLAALPDIYNSDKHDTLPFCYPGTCLDEGMLEYANTLLRQHINLIGSHTRVEINNDGMFEFPDGEGGFETVQEIEARALFMVASMIGGKPKSVEGYFCGGGTEANYQGIWIGRQALRRCPDPYDKGIVVLTTPIRHYSIDRATMMMDIGEGQKVHCSSCDLSHRYMSDASGSGVNLVGMNGNGEMSIECLSDVFHRKYEEGFRRFIIAPTVGTTIMGSIDPVSEIAEFIKEKTRRTGVNFYMHVDASFAGFTAPFVNPDLKFGFSVPEVSSIALDADKMGHLPYPAGIFLCRNGLMQLVGQQVEYVRGNSAETISGSRTALAPALAWYVYRKLGVAGHREYVQGCLQVRDELIKLVRERLPWVELMPHSPWVNFAPMIIPIDQEKGKIPKVLTDKPKALEGCSSEAERNLVEVNLYNYQLRSDHFPVDPAHVNSCPKHVYKICIMPHHKREHLERFVDDIEKARIAWQNYKGIK